MCRKNQRDSSLNVNLLTNFIHHISKNIADKLGSDFIRVQTIFPFLPWGRQVYGTFPSIFLNPKHFFLFYRLGSESPPQFSAKFYVEKTIFDHHIVNIISFRCVHSNYRFELIIFMYQF